MVHPFRVNLANSFGPVFVDIFAPDYDSSLVHSRSKPRMNKRGNSRRQQTRRAPLSTIPAGCGSNYLRTRKLHGTRQSHPRPSSRVSRTWEEVLTLSSQVHPYSTFLNRQGTRSRVRGSTSTR